MAAINQITIAGGSTYDVNDKRITTSAVSTATHFLATDSSISSIAPITASNLASVLGVYKLDENPNFSDLNDAVGVTQGITYYFFSPSVAPQNLPSEISTTTRFFLEVINSTGKPNSYDIIQRITNRSSNVMYQRYRTGTSWSEWGRL